MAKTDGKDLLEKIEKTEKPDKPKTLVEFIEAMKPQIQRALPKHMDAERIARIAITILKTTPKLQSCEPMSFIAALMQSAQLGLEPNTPLGEAYLIPYYSEKRKSLEVNFQIGYKGILELAMRTGQYKAIYAHEVYKNDLFNYEYGLEKVLRHKPNDEPEGEPIYYYAVYHLKNGGYDFTVWSRVKVEKHKNRFSKAKDSGPWVTDFNSMAKKTVLIDLLKYAPKSIEFARQIATDMTIKKDISQDMTEVPSQDIDFIDVEPEGSELDNLKSIEKEIPEDSKQEALIK